MRLVLFSVLTSLAGASLCAAADAPQPVLVSAASPAAGITADSLATVYGDHLATQIASATPPWPTSLGDMPGVQITDSASQTRAAGLIYVSPGQMNLWIPPGVAPGPATLSFPVTGLPPGVGTAALRIVPLNIQKVAPGIFSADGSGTGVAAASAIRVLLPSLIQIPVPVFVCSTPSKCIDIGIDVGLDAPVYLSLYGTGIRGASAPANVQVTINSTNIQPIYVGPQLQIPGLDQINLLLPISLRFNDLSNVFVTVDGVKSNPVSINIQ